MWYTANALDDFVGLGAKNKKVSLKDCADLLKRAKKNIEFAADPGKKKKRKTYVKNASLRYKQYVKCVEAEGGAPEELELPSKKPLQTIAPGVVIEPAPGEKPALVPELVRKEFETFRPVVEQMIAAQFEPVPEAVLEEKTSEGFAVDPKILIGIGAAVALGAALIFAFGGKKKRRK